MTDHESYRGWRLVELPDGDWMAVDGSDEITGACCPAELAEMIDQWFEDNSQFGAGA